MKHIFFIFLAVLTLSACRSSKDLAKGTPADKADNAELVASRAALHYAEKVHDNAQKAKAVTARIKMELAAGGKDVSVGGTLRMKRDEVIRLSLTLLGFEVGRLEFTPSEVLILDRVNTQFVRAAYADVSFLRTAGLDFYALQSLFWNELFVPGEQRPILSRFTMGTAGDHTLLSLSDAPNLDYAFLTATATALIDRVTVESKTAGRPGRFEWRYADFVRLDGRSFPTTMRCSVTGLGKDVGFSLSLSRLDNDDRWETRTNVSAKYKERRADDILRGLLQH